MGDQIKIHGKRSVLITYQFGAVIKTIEGFGESVNEAIEHADSQLSEGSWKRLSISTPQSIFTDLRGRTKHNIQMSSHAARALRRGEGAVVEVRVTRVVHNA